MSRPAPPAEVASAPAQIEVSSTTRFRPVASVSSKPLGAELILVELERGATFRLNPTGVLVWELCQARRNLEEIVGHLQAEYKVPPDQLEHEVRGLIAQLLAQQLLQAEVE